MTHWKLTTAAAAGADYFFNDSKLTLGALGKAADVGGEVAQQGIDKTAEKISAKFADSIDSFLGADSEAGAFMKDHWGKLILSGLSLGLLGTGNTSLGLFIGLGVAAYAAYSHVSKNGFNTAAIKENAASLAQKTGLLPDTAQMKNNPNFVGTGTQHVRAPSSARTVQEPQPEPQ
ncbi:MAG: hypothetical protein IT559_06350 [Alphaproteobacteria bacterium]|nr:hypothetical protein [Alphaproteobacteria bacterium]